MLTNLSKVSRFRRRRLELLVAAVDIRHARIDEFRRIDAVERRQHHGIESAFAGFGVRMPEGPHAAGPAEAVMDAPWAELVVREVGFPGEQPDVVGAHRGEPRPLLCADRAVALDRPGPEVE